MEREAEHARLAPSSADLRVGCAGSLQMEEVHGVDEETEHTRTGTAAHWVVLQMARGTIILPGDIAPNGVLITEEMIDGAQMFLDDIDERLRPYPDAAACLTFEQPVDCSHIHAENWGTPDADVYIESDLQLFIWDYKYGFRYVPAQTWQLKNYADGRLVELGIPEHLLPFITVTLVIVQPRFYGGSRSRSWSCKASELKVEIQTLAKVYANATGPNPICSSGLWCGDCKARHKCGTFHKATSAAVDYIEAANVIEFDDQALGTELVILEAAADRIDAQIKALRADAEARIHSGRTVANYGTQDTYGLQDWDAPVADVLLTGELFGVNLKKPDKAVTPKQAIKLGVDRDTVNAMSSTQKTGVKVVRRDKSIAYAAFTKGK